MMRCETVTTFKHSVYETVTVSWNIRTTFETVTEHHAGNHLTTTLFFQDREKLSPGMASKSNFTLETEFCLTIPESSGNTFKSIHYELLPKHEVISIT